MSSYTLIAGVNGTGKSSLRGVLEAQGIINEKIIDPDLIAKENNLGTIDAGKQAIDLIDSYLQKNISFTQETTLSGHRIHKTVKQASKQGYTITLFYVGLNTLEESLLRIENRVRKGGHSIPTADVSRRFSGRITALMRLIPYCDSVTFYDNENGFVEVAAIRNNEFSYTSNYRPSWICQIDEQMKLAHEDCKL